MKNTRKVVVLLLSLVLVLGALFALTACSGDSHVHTWTEADCTTPKSCTECGIIAVPALGHTGGTATCDEQATCDRCGEKYGSKVAHVWTDATCTAPKTCTLCGKTEGGKVAHVGGTAVCGSQKTCDKCGQKYGDVVVAHDFNQQIRNEETRCSEATCLEDAKYFFSCVCGAVDRDGGTFNADGTKLSHADANKDHVCDNGCGNKITDHVDADKDHVCDNGCDVAIGECADLDKNHACVIIQNCL